MCLANLASKNLPLNRQFNADGTVSTRPLTLSIRRLKIVIATTSLSLAPIPLLSAVSRSWRRILIDESSDGSFVRGEEILLQLDLGSRFLVITTLDRYDYALHWIYLLSKSGKVLDVVCPRSYFGFVEKVCFESARAISFGVFGTNDRWLLKISDAPFLSLSVSALAQRLNRFLLRRRFLAASRTKGERWEFRPVFPIAQVDLCPPPGGAQNSGAGNSAVRVTQKSSARPIKWTSIKLACAIVAIPLSMFLTGLSGSGYFMTGVVVALPLSILYWLDLVQEIRSRDSNSTSLHILGVLMGIPQALFGLLCVLAGLSIIVWVLYNTFVERQPEYSGSLLSFGLGPVLCLFGMSWLVSAFPARQKATKAG